MKKIIITLVMLVCVSMHISSNILTVSDRLNVEDVSSYIKTNKNYNFSTDIEQLGINISLDDDSLFKESYIEFCDRMKACGFISDKSMKRCLFCSSVSGILNSMSNILTKEQYRQFLINLNLIMYKHGFLKESGEYCNAFNKFS